MQFFFLEAGGGDKEREGEREGGREGGREGRCRQSVE